MNQNVLVFHRLGIRFHNIIPEQVCRFRNNMDTTHCFEHLVPKPFLLKRTF